MNEDQQFLLELRARELSNPNSITQAELERAIAILRKGRMTSNVKPRATKKSSGPLNLDDLLPKDLLG